MIKTVLAVLVCFIGLFYNHAFQFKKRIVHKISLNAAKDPKEALKEEQFRIQQEMLARRRNKSNMEKYFKEVDNRRKDVSKNYSEKKWRDSPATEDPLNKWLEAKKQGKINPIGYEPAPSKSESILGFNLVLPLNPIGMPKYDDGERFDLRLPYAETGYEDPEG